MSDTSKNRSKFSSRVGLAIFSLGLLLTQFNNCGQYSQPTMMDDSSSILNCLNADCIDETPENLNVLLHIGGGVYTVMPGVNEFNLGGDCNEGGYPFNLIHWELTLNGIPVRNSSQGVAGGAPADTRCNNGRFMLYVYLGPIAGDNINRTGLATGGSYNLNITIYGQTTSGGMRDPNVAARTTVPLVPFQ